MNPVLELLCVFYQQALGYDTLKFLRKNTTVFLVGFVPDSVFCDADRVCLRIYVDYVQCETAESHPAVLRVQRLLSECSHHQHMLPHMCVWLLFVVASILKLYERQDIVHLVCLERKGTWSDWGVAGRWTCCVLIIRLRSSRNTVV